MSKKKQNKKKSNSSFTVFYEREFNELRNTKKTLFQNIFTPL